MEELKFKREEAVKFLIRIRNFTKDVDNLSYDVAFSIIKNLREDVGKFLDEMYLNSLIDRSFLIYIGFPKCVQNLDDIGISNMELLLLNIIDVCDGKSSSLEEMLTKI